MFNFVCGHWKEEVAVLAVLHIMDKERVINVRSAFCELRRPQAAMSGGTGLSHVVDRQTSSESRNSIISESTIVSTVAVHRSEQRSVVSAGGSDDKS